MRLKHGTLHYEETASSRRGHYDDEFGPLDVGYVFSAMLECTSCKESVSCCGEGQNERVQFEDPDGNPVVDYSPIFFPSYFCPAMVLLKFSDKVPSKVRETLHKSFALFFCDFAAAANNIRQCAEEILSHAGIPAKDANGKFVTMENRINAFKQKDPDNADRVSALRWIGNFGSHPQSLTQKNVFDAYDILEILLEDLYIGHVRSVAQLVAQINQSKGP